MIDYYHNSSTDIRHHNIELDLTDVEGWIILQNNFMERELNNFLNCVIQEIRDYLPRISNL